MPIPEFLRQLRAKIGHDMLFIPGVVAIITDDAGRVLLQRRSDNGTWSLIGGIMEPGETPAQSVIRESLEECGLTVVAERLVGVYTQKPTIYPNQDEIIYLAIVFACRAVAGQPTINDDESLEIHYFPSDALPETLADEDRDYIFQALKNLPTTDYILPTAKI